MVVECRGNVHNFEAMAGSMQFTNGKILFQIQFTSAADTHCVERSLDLVFLRSCGKLEGYPESFSYNHEIKNIHLSLTVVKVSSSPCSLSAESYNFSSVSSPVSNSLCRSSLRCSKIKVSLRKWHPLRRQIVDHEVFSL